MQFEASAVPGGLAGPFLIRAAEYVRMSTDHQKYSTENQSDAIRAYAERRGMTVVRTYSDAGKSGLSFNRRPALQQLIDDVQKGCADFKMILVYDVSRWGRFQDVDESAYYEYMCKRAGVNVQYCAEQFENDGSPIAAIIKSLKRAMAAEYSRELSVKTFAGLSRIVELGFRPGGSAGYGYRRLLVGPDGSPKSTLAHGERKSIATDRIKLVPGPANEVEAVRWIFSAFVERRLSEFKIACALNERRVQNSVGGVWTHRIVTQILRNEKYIGNNVWNRTSFKLQKTRLYNDPKMWLRSDSAFEPIVDRVTFHTAQTLLAQRPVYTCRGRRKGLADEQMLDALRDLLARNGHLTAALINRSRGIPSSAVYRQRFGGLTQAYRLIGYKQRRQRGTTRLGRPMGLSDEEMLTAIKRLWNLKGTLNRKIMCASKEVPSLSAYYKRFGNMFSVYRRIGFTPDSARVRARRSPRFAPDEVLIEGLREVLREKGRLSRRIIDTSNTGPSRGSLVKRFGSLLAAYQAVGYEPDSGQRR
jgi:DNA invertase Pin-like site-specific DNA recombinase